MQNHSKLLAEINSNLEEIIKSADALEFDDIIYFKTIKKIIEIKLNNEGVNNFFEKQNAFLISLARGEFHKRLSVENSKDLFTYFSTGLNVLAEELETRMIATELGEKCMNFIIEGRPDLVILTTVEGKIKYVSQNSKFLLGYSKEQLLSYRIQNFITENIRFETSPNPEEQEILLISEHVKIPAILTVKEFTVTDQISPYFLYMIKEKDTI